MNWKSQIPKINKSNYEQSEMRSIHEFKIKIKHYE